MPEGGNRRDQHRDPTRLTRAEWVLLVVLAAMQFTHIVDFVIMMPLGPVFTEALDITPQSFGWLVSAYGFSASISGLFASRFIDRYDRKNALLLLYAGFTVGTLLCAAAPTYRLLLMARAVAGGFAGVMAASVLAVVGDVFPDVRRGTAMGVVMSAFSVAAIVGIPVGLYLADLAGWRLPFVALGVLSMGAGGVAWCVLPPLRRHMDHAGQRASTWDVCTNPRHLRAYLLMAALVMGSFVVGPYLNLYLVNNVGLPQEQLKYVWLCGGLATLLTTPYFGRLADRHGKLRMFRYLQVFTLIPTILITNLPQTSLAAVLAATTLYMVATSGRMVPAMALITASTHARQRGSFMNVNGSVQQLGMGLAPILSGLILGSSEGDEPLTGFPAVGLLGAGIMLCSVYLAGRLRPEESAPEMVPALSTTE